MAIANNHYETRYATEDKGLHWLYLKNFGYADDISGHEFIELQAEIRAFIAKMQDQLQSHNISIANVATQQQIDHRRLGSRVSVAIAFKTKEELVMAKLALECDELD
jgi:hypothetical protein